MAFKYRRRSPFPLLLRIAKREMDTIEDFLVELKKPGGQNRRISNK